MSTSEAFAAVASVKYRSLELPPAGDRASELMRAAYWALDGTGSVGALCAGMPRLLAQLARRTLRKRVEEPEVRGRIDWPATARARVRTGSDASIVTRVVERSFDVKENQLLKFVVARCLEAIDHVPATIRDGMLHEPALGAVALGAVRERIELVRCVLGDRKLQNRLASVRACTHVDRTWVDAARVADVRDYQLVVAAYEEWRDRVRAATWEMAVPGGIVLVPSTIDEPWLVLGAKRTASALRLGRR
jgi:hypothetical protein